jgi:hypothetical protein
VLPEYLTLSISAFALISFIPKHTIVRNFYHHCHKPQLSFKDSARFDPIFSCLDFVAVIFTQQCRHHLPPTTNVEDKVSGIMAPSDRVVQLYPQAPGSLFVVFYDSHGYGGGILTFLHTEIKIYKKN